MTLHPDFTMQDEGSIVLITPLSDIGREWLRANVGEQDGFQPYWPTVVVEHRYADDVIEGMQLDGLEAAT